MRRIFALPVGSLAAAALFAGLAWTTIPPNRWLALAAVSGAIFAVYQAVAALRLLVRRRRVADNWLRSATAGFVPEAYAWRAAQLCDPRERRMLARTLRQIEQMAFERRVGRRIPLYLPAVREHRESVNALARTLENLEDPVTPAGMLRVLELVQDGGGPLWSASRGPALGEAISRTLEVLTPGTRGTTCS